MITHYSKETGKVTQWEDEKRDYVEDSIAVVFLFLAFCGLVGIVYAITEIFESY